VEYLDKIYHQHRERLFNYLMRMTGDYDLARDIVQESYARCLNRYGGKIDSASLLYRIARNLVVDDLRKRSRSEPFEERQAVDPASLHHHIMVREEYREVMGALQDLCFEDRELLSLVAVESLRYSEIAEVLNTSVGNVKVRVHRARKRLRSALAERERGHERAFNQSVYR
jgi:RNA polymerase sigma-70 factor, ECF subfamily